jgi:hypothetical protein
MSYRTIEVDGMQYEYTIGKTYMKIKSVGVFPVSQIGIARTHSREDPDLPHEMRNVVVQYRVTPSIIVDIIKHNR